MAEKNEETPENIQEEVEQAAEGTPPEAPEASANEAVETAESAAPDESSDDAPAEAAAAKPKAGRSRRESLEARRAERQAAAGKRPPRAPEERDAERRERRAALAKQRRAYRSKLKAKKAETRKTAPEAEEHHAPEHGPGRPKVRQGVVVSEKGEKTITVRIDVVKRHRRYHKILRSTVKLYAHDERGDAHEGDTVRVVECRPMSRTKRWRLVEVLERAK
jgi:small subunit ribosomal protein S17